MDGNKENGKKGMSDSELNEKTKVPLGLVITTLAAFLGAAIWINNSLNQIRSELEIIKHSVSGQFTARDMEIWIMKLRLENPALKVPEVQATRP
jgi:hypothetical protein